MTIEETVGSLKAHEERLHGQSESSGSQLLLTEEEWKKRENNEGQLLLTRDKWLKKSGRWETSPGTKNQGSGSYPRRDRSKVRCFSCDVYGHFVAECRKPKREHEKEQKTEVNLTQVHDEEPVLLMVERVTKTNDKEIILLNEADVTPPLSQSGIKQENSDIWYLDNGASNHMMGFRSKFKTLDENVQVE